MKKRAKLDLEKLAKKVEEEAKALLKKEEVHLPESEPKKKYRYKYEYEDAIESLIKRVVKEVLESEKVLVSISGKAKEYKRDSIAISKSDINVYDLKVEPESKDLGFDILEELKKIR